MRKHSLIVSTMIVLAVALILAVSAAVAAGGAEPSVGTWKLNVAQSKLTPTQPGEATPKEETVVKRELGNDFELTITGTLTNGSPIAAKATHPQQGGVIKSQQGAPAEGTFEVITVIGPGDFYETALQNGKQVRVEHIVVSKDGKTLRATIKGTDAQGQSYEQLEVFDKQ